MPPQIPESLRPVLQNRSMQVRKLRILPIEAIVRGLIMFSLLRLRAGGVDRAVGESLALLQTGGDLDSISPAEPEYASTQAAHSPH
jgi:phosphoribosylaminoimidazole-succinocarboxamide synthase